MSLTTQQQLEAIVKYVTEDKSAFKIMNHLSHYTDLREYLKDNIEVWELRRAHPGPNHALYFYLYRLVRQMMKSDRELSELIENIETIKKK